MASYTRAPAQAKKRVKYLTEDKIYELMNGDDSNIDVSLEDDDSVASEIYIDSDHNEEKKEWPADTITWGAQKECFMPSKFNFREETDGPQTHPAVKSPLNI